MHQYDVTEDSYHNFMIVKQTFWHLEGVITGSLPETQTNLTDKMVSLGDIVRRGLGIDYQSHMQY